MSDGFFKSSSPIVRAEDANLGPQSRTDAGEEQVKPFKDSRFGARTSGAQGDGVGSRGIFLGVGWL